MVFESVGGVGGEDGERWEGQERCGWEMQWRSRGDRRYLGQRREVAEVAEVAAVAEVAEGSCSGGELNAKNRTRGSGWDGCQHKLRIDWSGETLGTFSLRERQSQGKSAPPQARTHRERRHRERRHRERRQLSRSSARTAPAIPTSLSPLWPNLGEQRPPWAHRTGAANAHPAPPPPRHAAPLPFRPHELAHRRAGPPQRRRLPRLRARHPKGEELRRPRHAASGRKPQL
ncbi:unnamed protein product [Chondrus crispus]|uniref:Uncharacterized protein n=1 Tax=Chondrus crispus TaxID=2769 RepID=S0F2T7_CHOCR|nr:unnamed protein product [Chondrus crispus]CDF77405.1 unnamed protein product [Chondrus crispus]|eukprot:XP_005712279.1 unnamed protein product [Chondrus crispus]